MRAILTILLFIHGAIHLMGFLKWSKLAPVSQLSGRTLITFSPTGDRVYAILWLLALVAFFVAAALRIGRGDAWWIPALIGVVLSQGLIVFTWSDAKFGTIANVLILVPALIAVAHARFSHQVDAEARALLAEPSLVGNANIDPAAIERLPPSVRKWLESSGSSKHAPIQTVRLIQRGELRTAPDAAWLPAQAEQYFSTNPPAFVWRVDATMMGFLPIAGRDKYMGGHGHMLIKAASVLNIVDAADEKIDHGSLLRFLGETVWFPGAALSPHIEWESIDATRAKATMRHGGLVASAVFTFNEKGRVLRMDAERYLGGGADAKLTPWLVTCSEWRVFDGIEVPNRGNVGWSLPSGEFTYYRWEILDVEFNQKKLFGEAVSAP